MLGLLSGGNHALPVADHRVRFVHNDHFKCVKGDCDGSSAVAIVFALTLATAAWTWQQLVIIVVVVMIVMILEGAIVVTLHKVHCLEVFIVGTCREQMIIAAAADGDGLR